MRLPYDDVVQQLSDILQTIGFSPDSSQLAARLFTDASRDGIYSHGLNRFPGFVKMVRDGYVRPDAVPTAIMRAGPVEQWDGNRGAGMLNATHAMSRAMEVASENSIGMVGLRNTNHWMRGANYGWQAANAGCIGICWTNTLPNMVPWGGVRSGVGNNPLVVAVPRDDGHVVLDMAMSQFSYGRLGAHARSGEPLPVVGGVDASGKPTTDAREIVSGGSVWPTGYWKGSGLALMLDLIAALVSGGNTTRDIGGFDREHSVSQVFVAIDLSRLGESEMQSRVVNSIVEFMAAAGDEEHEPMYPGQSSLARRGESESIGIYVDEQVWQRITRPSSSFGSNQTQPESR